MNFADLRSALGPLERRHWGDALADTIAGPEIPYQEGVLDFRARGRAGAGLTHRPAKRIQPPEV